jgi:magnesium transporter
MLTLFQCDQDKLQQVVVRDNLQALSWNTVWVDLLAPAPGEELAIERQIGLKIPTREDMQEIEASSRLYLEKEALVMTMPVLGRSVTEEPVSEAVTFILTGNRLVTVRYADPVPFGMFIQRIIRQPSLAASGEQVLIGLLEQIADRLADILEGATADIEGLSRSVFHNDGSSEGGTDFKNVLRRIGRISDLATKAKDSLMNLNRLLLFFAAQAKVKRETKARMDTLVLDSGSIDEHAKFLSAKASFLLDATLGMINIEQNNIIKIFSVAAVAFLPPTLIASIYGMNFDAMPELKWGLGYPVALALMLTTAVLPFLYFRRKKWL